MGEFTICRHHSFNPVDNITPGKVRVEVDRNNLCTSVFALSHTKSSVSGEEVQWARQDGPMDPQMAFDAHMAVNNPPLNGPLFTYKDRLQHKPLTKATFISKSLCAGQHSPALDSCQSPSARSRLAIVVKHPIYYVELGDAMEVPYLLFYVTLKYLPELSILSITSMNPLHRHKTPQNGHNQFNIRYQNAMR